MAKNSTKRKSPPELSPLAAVLQQHVVPAFQAESEPGDDERTLLRFSLLDELPVILRVYVECAARLYGNPREADLIKIHLHSRKLTFHYYRDFDKAPLPELLTRIKIDLKRLFVTVIDHTTGTEHQLLFFKERFLPKDHPDRAKMQRFSAKLRKLGLREDTIGYGPSKEKWEAWNRSPQ